MAVAWLFLTKHFSKVLSFVAGFGICLLFFGISGNWTASNEPEEEEIRQSGYIFINPLLECEMDDSIISSKYIPFEDKTKKQIQEYISKNTNLKDVSVYFRSLNNGPWFGINEQQEFSPASLLKVPLAMAYYKKSESEQGLLEKKIVFSDMGPQETYQNLKPSRSLQQGNEYTVDELIEMMLVYSDNNAMRLLMSNMNESDLGKVYADLGVDSPNVKKPENFMSVKQYASFFRILYNASYLEKDDSEKILKLLSDVEYREGIVAGVPENIKVSHKFGEREFATADGYMKQLHDCGIIYYPQQPYLLCVMTRGRDFGDLSEGIHNVSNIVYNMVSGS
jgi:beta-lactamase class A